MTQVVYGGVHASVELPSLGIVAERGKPVDVDAEVAKRLLAQDAWSEATKPAPAKDADKGGK